jgi:phosphate transport system substrate-binding protein
MPAILAVDQSVTDLGYALAQATSRLQVSVLVATAEEARQALATGAADVALVADPFPTPGTGLTVTVIAREPIAVVVHPSNPVTELSSSGIGLILSGRVTDWREMGGSLSTLTVYARADGDTLQRLVNVSFLGSGGRLAPGAILLPSDAAVAEMVANQPDALGYLPWRHPVSGLKALRIDGVAPSRQAVVEGRYWLARPVALMAPEAMTIAARLLWAMAVDRRGQSIAAGLGYARVDGR